MTDHISNGAPLPSIDPFDGRSLQQFDRDWESAFNHGDYQTMAASYADDARLIATHAQTIVGRAHIAEFWREACAGGKVTRLRRTVHTERAEVSDQQAYLYGTVSLVVDDCSPALVRFVTIWERQPDGVWRIAVDISTPAPAHGDHPAGTIVNVDEAGRNAISEQLVRALDEAWSRNDVDAVLALFAPDATIESPAISQVFNRDEGVCHGWAEIRELVLELAGRGRPWGGHGLPIIRGNTIAVEHHMPSSEIETFSVDIVEVRDGRIHKLRAYAGWRAVTAFTRSTAIEPAVEGGAMRTERLNDSRSRS